MRRSSEREAVHIARRPDGDPGRSLLGSAHNRHTLIRRSVLEHQLYRPKRMWTAAATRAYRRTHCLQDDIHRAGRQ